MTAPSRRPAWRAVERGAVVLMILAASSALVAEATLPQDLTNFQNEYACDPHATLVVRPHTVADVQQAVALHDVVMANGVGHSWNQPFFCANASSLSSANGNMSEEAGVPRITRAAGNGSAANIVLTTIRPLTIEVNETEPSVWVDAGVMTIDLLEYLGNYVTDAAPGGYTLPAFPWFVYQSIGGAVATGTHGSSLTWNSLSHQVLALEVVLANGTLRTFTPETDPFLMKALRVSVGKLGIITRLKMRLVPEVPVERQLRQLSQQEYLALLAEAQAQWRANKTLPGWMDETEFFWITQPVNLFYMVSYTRADNVTDPAVRNELLASLQPQNTTVFLNKTSMLGVADLFVPSTNASMDQLQPRHARDGSPLYALSQEYLDNLNATTINVPVVVALSGNSSSGDGGEDVAAGSTWTLPKPKPPQGFYAAANLAMGYMTINQLGINQVAGNATLESSQAYIIQPETTLVQIKNTLFDQYEVSIPVAAMADCWTALLNLSNSGSALDRGFRTAPLIRFVGQEDGLLAHTHDGPRMFINVEDYLFYNQGRRTNARFKALIGLLTSDPRCTSKERGVSHMHWGKAGWPDPGCWHGDEQLGDNWCSFGCAIRALDPTGKFQDSAPDRWNWRGVDLDSCCGPEGFMSGQPGCTCSVQHARPMSACPPPPFYTYR